MALQSNPHRRVTASGARIREDYNGQEFQDKQLINCKNSKYLL